MANKLQVPINQNIFEGRGNAFQRVWFSFFSLVADRFKAFEQVTVATATVSAAPASYTQAHAQEQDAAIAELKAKVNALIVASQK